MYSTCLFCKAKLGSNGAIERFPVGTRLAFDSARGRLWVVCRRCSRWNLSPLEERWEAIETCEAAFRDTRSRLTTEHIGLARLGDGLELIRIGRPLRPEFAAWRYGTQLTRRRRQGHVEGAIAATAWIALGFLGAGLLHVPWVAYNFYLRNRTIYRISSEDGSVHQVAQKHAGALRLLPSEDGRLGWKVRVKHRRGSVELADEGALHLTAALLPLINASGADARQVSAAVGELERSGGPEKFFMDSAAYLERSRQLGTFRASDHRISDAPEALRLALEMAAHEELEQRALEGELDVLKRAWQEAEEIAAIADRLLLPAGVEEFIIKHGKP